MKKTMTEKQKAYVAELTSISGEIRTAETALDKLRTRRDNIVAKAREHGVSYAAISKATKKSISWVNGSLLKSGGVRPNAERRKEAS